MNGKDTFWFVLKMFVTTHVLYTCILGIRGLAQVRGITGDSAPLIIALIASIVLLYWAYEVVWRPVTPKPIVSVNTDNPVLFGDRVLFVIKYASITLAIFCVASAIFPEKKGAGLVPAFMFWFMVHPSVKKGMS